MTLQTDDPVTVVTSWGPHGWKLYGEQFVEGFLRHMPDHVRLVVYSEGPPKIRPVAGRLTERDFLRVLPARKFLRQYRHDAYVRGKTPQPCWNTKERARGYSFRTDAYKFFRKPLAIADALDHLETERYRGVLAWIDGDTRFRGPPGDRLAEVLPRENEGVTYLGRVGRHSECGFVGFRLPTAAPVIREWAAYYTEDLFRCLYETHDSYVFDVVRDTITGTRKVPEIVYRSISTKPESGHPWLSSPLYPWSDHLKGDRRKAVGKSTPKKDG